MISDAMIPPQKEAKGEIYVRANLETFITISSLTLSTLRPSSSIELR